MHARPGGTFPMHDTATCHFGRRSAEDPIRHRQSWSLDVDGRQVLIERVWSTDTTGAVLTDLRIGWSEDRPMSQLEIDLVVGQHSLV